MNTATNGGTFEKVYKDLMEEKIQQALESKLGGGKFIVASYPAGFDPAIQNLIGYYNSDTLSTLEATLDVSDDGVSGLKDQKLSTLYRTVLKDTSFDLSTATYDEMKKKDEALDDVIKKVVKEFLDAGYQLSKEKETNTQAMKDVFDTLSLEFGEVDQTCDCLPPYLAKLRNALSEYNEKAGNNYVLHSRASQAKAELAAIQANITEPGKGNGGLQTGTDSYYVGFDKLPSAKELSESLSNTTNVMKVHLEGKKVSESESTIHAEGKDPVTVPSSLIFSITFSDSTTFDMSDLTSTESSYTMDLTYPGLTVIGTIPRTVSNNQKEGWYDENILDEIKDKTGKDVDGFKLQGSEFSVKDLFGLHGKLNFFKTFVISRQPTIDVTITDKNFEQIKEHVHKDASVKVKLFGFIPIGEVKDKSYSLDSIDVNESENTITLHLGGSDSKMAYVLGGVPNYN